MKRVLVPLAAVTLAAASAAAVALAGTPLPGSPRGSGSEPTAGGGTLAGSPFVARSALVYRDGYGDVNLFLFARKVPCHAVSETDVPYVWAYVYSNGKPLPLGKKIALSDGRVVAVFEHHNGRAVVRTGVSLTLTRIDPTAGGVWHGRLTVPQLRSGGVTYAYSGTFAARWCGTY